MTSLDKEQKSRLPVSKESKEDHDDTDPEIACGIGAFKPKGLQACLRMGTFVGMYSASGLMTSVLSMYMVSQITTIEKQFGLSSTQSGFLMSCNDIGFLMTTVFASYITRKVHIPRMLWISTVFYGVGGLVCSSAYFVSKDVFKQQVEEILNGSIGVNDTAQFTSIPQFKAAPLCTGFQNSSTCGKGTGQFEIGLPNQYSQIAIGLIAFGMILQGIGKSPRFPFLATYVDDNGKKKNTAMYMGIIAGIGIFGPAIAFSVGGVFSKIYVTLEDVSITPRHPSWVGAWWLGYIIFGIISILTSFPLICFPRRMRPKRVDVGRSKRDEKANGCREFVKGFVKALYRLAKNHIYVLLLANNCISLFSVAGMISFSAKYLETQFFIPTWKANILLGATSIVSASLGTVIGGMVVTKRQLSPIGCIKFLIGISVTGVIILAFAYIIGCGNAHVIGLSPDSLLPTQDCVSDCYCDTDQFFPVCGSDGRNYFSPCIAGCKVAAGQVFTDCGCTGSANTTMVPGLCTTDCNMLIPFIVFSVLGNMAGTMAIMPGFIVSIRSVSDEDKSISVGVGSFMSSLLGFLLGPVVFGYFIDTTCMVWTTSCESTGACALYDNDRFRVTKTTLEVIPRVVSTLLYIVILLIAKRKTDWSVQENFRKDHNDVTAGVNGEDINGVKKALI